MYVAGTLKQIDLMSMAPADLAAMRNACLRKLQELQPSRSTDNSSYRELKAVLLAVDSVLGF